MCIYSFMVGTLEGIHGKGTQVRKEEVSRGAEWVNKEESE